MPMDYTNTGKKPPGAPGKSDPSKPPKQVEKVVTSTVVVKKKGVGRKFREIFIEADFGSVTKYLIYDVTIPAIRDLIVDAATKGVRRAVYGEAAMRRQISGPQGPRFTYNTPVNRGGAQRIAPALEPGPRASSRNEPETAAYLVSSKEEAEAVVEAMNNLIDVYDIADVADLHQLLGLPVEYTDKNWGWAILGGVPIRATREGFIIDFPPPDPIN